MSGETLIIVCFYGWVVCPLKTGLYKVNGRSARVTPGHTRPPERLPTRKNTQKSKFLLSQAFKWKKIMFFVIPEMPSKTFVMVFKKLPDHFKGTKMNLIILLFKLIYFIETFCLDSKFLLSEKMYF